MVISRLKVVGQLEKSYPEFLVIFNILKLGNAAIS